jgi:hypothetical protein
MTGTKGVRNNEEREQKMEERESKEDEEVRHCREMMRRVLCEGERKDVLSGK